jgi:two-component system sensor histidine kinase BaeS
MSSARLRTLLALAFAGVAFFATLAAFGTSLWATHRAIDNWSTERAGQTASAAVVAVSEARTQSGWSPAVRARLARELSLSGLDYRLRDERGRVVFETARLAQLGTAPDPLLTRPVAGSAGTLDVFVVARPDAQATADQIETHLDVIHLIAALGAAVLASLVGVFAAGRLARPLQRLATLAPRLSRAEDAPPILHAGPREVRDVAIALEDLSGSLRRQRTARVQLAQDLAHELRTPLALAQARLEAIEDGLVPLDREQVAVVRGEVVRLGRLVGEIERLADAEVTPRSLDIGPVDLAEIARQQRAVVIGAGHRFDADIQTAVAHADRDAVDQIVGNLVANGLHHGPAGGQITIQTGSDEATAWLRVIDEGGGVPDGDAAFGRFHRGAGASDDGFGIGLAIARDLAEALNGSLALDQHAPRTTFVLTLPAEPVAPTANRGPIHI